MSAIKEQQKQQKNFPSAQKNRQREPVGSIDTCGGCTSCHQMTRIHTAPNSPTWGGSDDENNSSGSHKPCAIGFFQRNLGNSYFQSLADQQKPIGVSAQNSTSAVIQRKCNCGGSCSGCGDKEDESLSIQAKLKVGPANDTYEQEADRVADRIMRMPDKPGSSAAKASGERHPIKRVNTANRKSNSISDRTISKDGGRPLSEYTRSFMEPQFGADFSKVRIHTDKNTQQIASRINARAYTFGNHIGLNRGESENDRGLMAHELTHVVQQNGNNCGIIQRIITVNPSVAAADDILCQLRFLCSSCSEINLDRSGQTITAEKSSIASHGCECVSDAIGDPDRTYTINVDNVTDNPQSETLHDGSTATIPYPSSGPRTYNGTNPTIHMPSSSSSVMDFGGFSPSGAALFAPNWRILGHELCGHGRLKQSYAGDKGDRQGHDVTIDTENAIAGEHGEPARGHYTDHRQGESYHNPAGNMSRIVFKLIDGWHYEAP